MHWIDPQHLPATTGTLDRLPINPRGEIDGLVFVDGTEIHVPPHLSEQVRAALRPGLIVAVRGVRPRGVDMIAAVAIETPDGARMIDDGPPHNEKDREAKRRDTSARRTPMEIAGVVRQALHGPKGEVRGALLEDGRIVRIPPPEAAEHAALLQAGSHLAVRGDGVQTDLATVVEAREIGASIDQLRALKRKPKHDQTLSQERVPPSGKEAL